MAPLKTGPWKLTDLEDVPKNGLKVMSCFHCGGGSTMGYKLAGYEVLGGVEIDPEMMKVYRANHNPKHSFLMGVEEFNKLPRDKIPKEFFDLDILDGSPPCSSFSTAGSRDKAWGEKKKFREGQADQVLDDLFFHFIETAKILQPKVVIAENVKGLVVGKAKGYVKQIAQHFNLAGYDLQLFLLNSAFMGVPQKRERTFFIARKRSLGRQELKLDFKEKTIPFKDIKECGAKSNLSPRVANLWKHRLPKDLHIGFINQRLTGKLTGFTTMIQKDDMPLYTITASDSNILFSEPRTLTSREVILGQSFPDDYNFMGLEPKYICGMSVPPFMMQRVASEIERQWFSKDKP
jgi:DNA (cytosine-5)-methyltransferase 1